MSRRDDRRIRGFGASHPNRHSQWLAIGKPDVEHRHLRARGRDPDERLLDARRLAHDLQVVLGLKELTHTATDNLMVVDEKHGDHRLSMPPSYPLCCESLVPAGQDRGL